MIRSGKTLVCLLCIIALIPKVRAVSNDAPSSGDAKTSDASDNSDSPESPYSAIWLRNVFDLKPIIVVTNTAPVTNAPPPNVELTGITTLLGTKRALFMVQESAGVGKPVGKEESYILTEGQRQGVLEVLEIDPKAKMVKIKVEEAISTITFKTNKPPVGPQGGAPVGAPNGGIPRPPMFTPPGFNNPSGAPGGVPIPPRAMRPATADNNSQYSPQGNQYNQNAYNQNNYNQQGVGGGYYGGGYNTAVGGVGGVGVNTTTPGLSLPSFGGAASPTYVPAPESVPPEVTGAILNVQKAAAENAGSPFPPLPPPFQVNESGASGGNSSGEAPPIPPSLPPIPGQKSTGTLSGNR